MPKPPHGDKLKLRRQVHFEKGLIRTHSKVIGFPWTVIKESYCWPESTESQSGTLVYF